MKKIAFTLLASLSILYTASAQNIDSLQKQLEIQQELCSKAALYTNSAADLIQYNQPKTRDITVADAAKATEFVLKAIHINSKYDDTLAIRDNFNCLAQAYLIQKKYTQAKWFILQSNAISRNRKDVPEIINSLVQLASVKIIIKDYALAQKDLQEGIVLAKYENDIPAQISVERNLAALYSKQGKLKNATELVEHYSLLSENLQKASLKKYYAMQKVKAKTRKPKVLEAKQVMVSIDEPTIDLNKSISETSDLANN